MKRLTLSLGIVPWLLATPLVGYWVVVHFAIPTLFYIRYDPEMMYAFNSLGVFKGAGYAWVDHPGTQVELLGSALYALTAPVLWFAQRDLVQFHVTYPEFILAMARAFLTALSVISLTVLFRLSAIGRTWLALERGTAVALLFFSLTPVTLESLITWSQNSLAFPFGTLLLSALWLTMSSGQPLTWKRVAVLGFWSGVLAAAQIYYVTWVIGIAATLMAWTVLNRQGWRRALGIGLLSGIACAGGFALAILPALPYFGIFVGYLTRIIFHQGVYGMGQEGIASLDVLSANFLQLWSQFPVLYLAVASTFIAAAACLVWRRHSIRENPKAFAAILGLSLQLLVMFSLVVKHPGMYYMLAVAAILPVLLVALLSAIGSGARVSHLITVAVCLLVLWRSVGNFFYMVDVQRSLQSHEVDREEHIQRQVDDYAIASGKDPASVVLLRTYGVPSPCYVRMFSSDLVPDYALGPEVARACRPEQEFDIWSRTIRDARGVSHPLDSAWDMIVASQPLVESKTWGDYAYLTGLGTVVTDRDAGLLFIVHRPTAPVAAQ